MSDQQPEATPEQEAHVRRLLAGARHTDPMPPEVAHRLDGVLAQLVSEGPRAVDPPPPSRPAPVDELAARRRRRVTGLLVAAAAVVVLGVGISQVTDLSDAGGGNDDGASAGGSTDSDSSYAEQAPDRNDGPAAPSAAPSVPPTESESTDGPAPTVSTESFRSDAARLRSRASIASESGTVVTGDELSGDPAFVCDPTPTGPGLVLGVRFEGRPAVLAYRPVRGDTQPVELLRCGTGDVLRSTVLPAP